MVDLRTRDMTFCVAHAQARARGTTRVASAVVCNSGAWRRAGGPLGQRRGAAARKPALSLQDAKMRPRSARHDTRREGARVLYLRRGARWRPLGQRRCAAGRKRALSLQDAKMRPRSAARWPRLARPGHPCYWCCSRLRTALLPPPAQRRVHRLALQCDVAAPAGAILGLLGSQCNRLQRWI